MYLRNLKPRVRKWGQTKYYRKKKQKREVKLPQIKSQPAPLNDYKHFFKMKRLEIRTVRSYLWTSYLIK